MHAGKARRAVARTARVVGRLDGATATAIDAKRRPTRIVAVARRIRDAGTARRTDIAGGQSLIDSLGTITESQVVLL